MSTRILDVMARKGFEELIALHDRESGLRAFLGIHDTSPGVAFGGIRRWSYPDEDRALIDCLRLARAMTRKCAMADIEAGGGKVVVLESPDLDPAGAYRKLGEAVDRLGGRFYTGPDVGTGDEELGWVAERTRFVTRPGDEGPGELAASTAAGVLAGMAAALIHLDGREDWEKRTIVVQGLGSVGARLSRELVRRGARVLAAEVRAERASEVAAGTTIKTIDPATAFDVPCDVFAPCALGGILHDLTLKRLKCRIIAGGANNLAAGSVHEDRLHELGILCVPDFVINSGALIRGATFHMHGERTPVEQIGARIGEAVAHVLRSAKEEDLPPARFAEREADRRIRSRRRRRAPRPSAAEQLAPPSP